MTRTMDSTPVSRTGAWIGGYGRQRHDPHPQPNTGVFRPLFGTSFGGRAARLPVLEAIAYA
jgi:hypothetical protein